MFLGGKTAFFNVNFDDDLFESILQRSSFIEETTAILSNLGKRILRLFAQYEIVSN
jgi:hypothetical protein